MSSEFEKFRVGQEAESIPRHIREAQINIIELFWNRLLGAAEAEAMTAALSGIQSQTGLDDFKRQMEKEGVEGLQYLEHTEENEVAVNNLRNFFQECLRTLDSENWRTLLSEFIAQTELRHPSVFHETLVRGWLSRLLEDTYGLYRKDGRGARQLGDDLTALMRESPALPEFLSSKSRVVAGKRQPAFLETVAATLERLELAERLPGLFGAGAEAIIIGGSLSYGPFYNVRKNMDATGSSDIDIICVADSLGSAGWGAIKEAEQFVRDDRATFLDRLKLFERLRLEAKADVISQRFRVVDADFTVSAHCFPFEIFAEMNNNRLRSDLERNEDTIFQVRDYKANRFEHQECVQQSFDGEAYRYRVPDQAPVEKGLVAALPGYIVSSGRYYPGLYQNLISPEFSILHDATGSATNTVGLFIQILANRLAEESRARPDSQLTRSHIRNRVFAPERYLD